MKYRRLHLAELEAVESEFVSFLAINGIDADIWQILKQDSNRSGKLLDAFSDAWFEMHLRKIKYVDVLLADELFCFQFNVQNAVLVGMKWPLPTNKADYSDNWFQQEMVSGNCEVYTSSRSYSGPRELEIFNILEKGGVVADGSRFKLLWSVLP